MSPALFIALTSLYLLGFALLHSLLASHGVKSFFHRHSGRGFAFYRLFYNLFNLALLVLFFWHFSAFDRELYRWPEPMVPLARIIQACGAGLILWVLFIAFDFGEFSGLKPSRNLTPPPRAFRRTGPFRFCRHPMYFGTFILFLAFPNMSLLIAVFTVFILLYSLLGSIPEERKLTISFGPNYELYRRTTKRIIPFIL